MNIEYYESFEKELEAGLKKQATASVKKFVDSFKSREDINNWVWSYLPNLEKNHHSCIRYEIFINLVYPTLKQGFESNDYDSTLWLGKLVQNVYQTKGTFEELGSLTERDFYRKCYEIDSSNPEGKTLLLKSILNWFSHCEHEWPAGILYAMDGATNEQCEIIKNEIDFALTLVSFESDKAFIEQFRSKLRLYEERLNKSLK